jgi:hypothetical protein
MEITPARIKSIINRLSEIQAELLILLNEETPTIQPEPTQPVWTSTCDGCPESAVVYTPV